MADGAKFVIIRKLLKALGLSEEAINDVVEWIEDLLTGKTGKQELTDLPYKLSLGDGLGDGFGGRS